MVVVTDLHFGRNADTIIVDDVVWGKVTSRELDLLNRLTVSGARARELQQVLVLGGDIFESVSPSTKVISLFLSWLMGQLMAGTKVIIIPGNHDSTVDFVNTLMFVGMADLVDNLTVITEPCSMTIEGMSIYFIPHIPRDKITPELFEGMKDKHDYYIGHGQITGTNSGYDNDCFYEAGKAVDLTFDMFPENAVVVLGHEHNHAEYKRGTKIVMYPGSITENNFGEAGDAKGYYILEPKGYEWKEFSAAKYPYFNMDLDLTAKDFEYTADDLREYCAGKIIKVIVTAKDALAVNQIHIQRVIAEAGGYVTRFETKIVGRSSTELAARSLINHDHATLLKEYLAKQTDLTETERKDALDIGLSVIDGGLS